MGALPGSVHALNYAEIHELRRELASLTQQLEESEERERRRIAREMHDSSVQDLVAIGLILKRLQGMIFDADAKAVLGEVRSILAKTQQDLRTLSYLLHPPVFDGGGLVAALEGFIHGLSSRMTMRIDLMCDAAEPRCSHEVENVLFRVVQEALINVHKHAGASYCVVRYYHEGNQLVLEIEDDGVGLSRRSGRSFDPGVGIPAMRTRVEQLGGRLILSGAESGLRVRAVFPAAASDLEYLVA